jgi:hypothetical protein
MFHEMKQVFSFSWKNRIILVEAGLKLLISDWLLHILPLPRIKQILARRFKTHFGVDPQKVQQTIWQIQPLVEIAARHHLYPMTCLRQALTLQDMLARRGIPTQLCLGARKENGTLLAHAWLEFEGQPLVERQNNKAFFTPFIPVEIKS